MTILPSLLRLFPSFLLVSSPASFSPVLFLTGMYHAGLEVTILLVQLGTGTECVLSHPVASFFSFALHPLPGLDRTHYVNRQP